MEGVKQSRKEVLPSLPEDQIQRVVLLLNENYGVEGVEDLCFVKEEDMADHLKPIQCRKLLNRWNPKENQQNASIQSPQPKMSVCSQLPEHNSPSPSPSFRGDAQNVNSNILLNKVSNNWHLTFDVPSISFGKEITDCLKKKKRLPPKSRREMVRKLVDEVRLKCLNPTRQQLSHLASSIAKQFPDSFLDKTDDGTIIGSGFGSVLNQLKSRVENLNRGNPETKIRSTTIARQSTSNIDEDESESSVSTCRKRKAADSYGCINWQPQFSEENSEKEMMEEKDKLKELYMQGPSKWNHGQIDQLMSKTYSLQRFEINTQTMSVDVLKINWPSLFDERWLLLHFRTLVGINLREKLIESNKSVRIINFMEKTNVHKDVRTQLNGVIKDSRSCESKEDLAVAFLLLATYYKEEQDKIMKLMEPTCTVQELNTTDLPVTPCLIVLALYVLNIMYPEEAGITLEFIQRCFVCINPESGSKVLKGGKKKKESVSPKVLTLIKALSDFEWMDIGPVCQLLRR